MLFRMKYSKVELSKFLQQIVNITKMDFTGFKTLTIWVKFD